MRSKKNRPQCPWSGKPNVVDLDSLRMIRYGIDRSCTSAASSSRHSQLTRTFLEDSRTCFSAGNMTGSQGWHPGPLKHSKRSWSHSSNELLTCILGSVLSIIDKYFPERKYARSLGKIWPKVFPNVLDSVNTQPVYAIVLHQLVDPIQQLANDCGILRVKIRQWQIGVSEPALLYGCLVPRIRGLVNKATVVKGRSIGERRGEVGKVDFGVRRCHVVHDDVEHQIHPAFVKGVTQCM